MYVYVICDMCVRVCMYEVARGASVKWSASLSVCSV
jgi:hypothetical protein